MTAGNNITINYQNATIGTNEYVSAILLDSSDHLLYYGHIVDMSSGTADGTAEIKIPSGLEGGNYTIKVFSEQCNGDKKTDYASAFSTINVSVESGGSPTPDPSPSGDDDHSDNDSGDSGSKPKEEKPFDYLDELRAKLKTAIDLGGEQTFTWDKGTALPYDIMKTLQDNPKITLEFSYTYENVDFKVMLNGKTVKAYTNIPWYGPLYLYTYYGRRSAVQNAPVANANRTYTVVKGDTLTGIAIKLNTSVRHLVSLNSIKDHDRISVGQVLKY